MSDNLNINIDDYSRQAKDAANKALVSRSHFLVGMSAASVGAGIVVPAFSGLLDIFFGLSISITTVILIISFSGKKIKDVEGLPLVIAIAIFFRFAVLINSTKYILTKSNPSLVQGLFARFFLIDSGFIWLILPAAAFLCLWVMIKAAGAIEDRSRSFTLEILPLKKSVIESRKNIGSMSADRARQLNDGISQEGKFYVSMLSIGGIFKGEAIAGTVVVVVIAVSSAVLSVLDEDFAKFYTAKSAGTTAIYLLQMSATALAAAMVVKDIYTNSSQFDYSREEDDLSKDQQQSPKLLNPDFVKKNNVSDESLTKDGELEIKDAEFDSEKEAFENLRKWSDRHYEKISKTLINLPDDKSRVILLGSDSYLNLPVNIPVNIAIKLASANRRCVLVDMDKSRNAIERVFADDNEKTDPTDANYRSTCISNVWINNNSELTIETVKEFSHTIIYAPDLEDVLENEQLKNLVSTAILFEAEPDILDEARERLKNCGIKIINIKGVG